MRYARDSINGVLTDSAIKMGVPELSCRSLQCEGRLIAAGRGRRALFVVEAARDATASLRPASRIAYRIPRDCCPRKIYSEIIFFTLEKRRGLHRIAAKKSLLRLPALLPGAGGGRCL